MWDSEKDEFIRKLFTCYNSKDAEKLRNTKRSLALVTYGIMRGVTGSL